MSEREALEIVLSLAQENALDNEESEFDEDGEETEFAEQIREQNQALELVEQMINNLTME